MLGDGSSEPPVASSTTTRAATTTPPPTPTQNHGFFVNGRSFDVAGWATSTDAGDVEAEPGSGGTGSGCDDAGGGIGVTGAVAGGSVSFGGLVATALSFSIAFLSSSMRASTSTRFSFLP